MQKDCTHAMFFCSRNKIPAMKKRETNLHAYISEVFDLSATKLKLSFDELKASHQDEILRVYRLLGGILDTPPLRFGPCDIVTKNFVVELDEEQHFNRYRKLTLGSVIYSDTKWFDHVRYKAYCDDFEELCLKKAARGGYWSNASTEKQFGPAAEKGVFAGNGSPRWKQRAFYDFCKDFAGKVNDMPIFRLSVYDSIDSGDFEITLGKALDQNRKEWVIEFLKQKFLK